jgi:hypothetical protein
MLSLHTETFGGYQVLLCGESIKESQEVFSRHEWHQDIYPSKGQVDNEVSQITRMCYDEAWSMEGIIVKHAFRGMSWETVHSMLGHLQVLKHIHFPPEMAPCIL